MRKREILTSFIFIILMTSLVSSTLTASIDKPKMVLYKNISAGDILEFENSVIANNENDYDVNVIVTPTGNWTNRTILRTKEFVLKQGESKEIFYTIKIDKEGYYSGDILVTFKDVDTNTDISVAQDLAVIVNPVEKQSKNILLPIVVGVIGILILLVILKVIKKK